MHYFFAQKIEHNIALLDADESLHLSKVLRLKTGDDIGVLDGSGIIYSAKVRSVHAKASEAEIVGVEKSFNPRPYCLHVAMAPTKMMERFEWFLEKAVEIGIDEITPILTERTERTTVKMARVENVVKAAMKQSLNAKTPRLNEACSFNSFIKEVSAKNRFIAHCADSEKILLPKAALQGSDLLVCIGPEGDFSPREIAAAIETGFMAVSLGESRLRAETAGVVACAQVQAAWMGKYA